MVKSHTVIVCSDYLPKKSLLGGGGEWVGGWQTKFSVSPGPGLWSLVLDLDLTWDLDLSLTKSLHRFWMFS